MNCPFHLAFTRAEAFLPRPADPLCEMGTVYRYEKSGVLHGLLRVRGFTQDDAHHFCRPDQMPEEIDFVSEFLPPYPASLRLQRDFKAYLSTKPAK